MLGVVLLRTNMEERACLLAEYIIENRATCRAAAKKFGISKSTVHKDISDRLRAHHPALYCQAQEVLQENKAQRHLRGGAATKRKWEERSKKAAT